MLCFIFPLVFYSNVTKQVTHRWKPLIISSTYFFRFCNISQLFANFFSHLCLSWTVFPRLDIKPIVFTNIKKCLKYNVYLLALGVFRQIWGRWCIRNVCSKKKLKKINLDTSYFTCRQFQQFYGMLLNLI